MRYVITCDKKAHILLPNGMQCKVKDTLPCPTLCKFKCSLCANRKEFVVKTVADFNSSNGRAVEYTSSEITALGITESRSAATGEDNVNGIISSSNTNLIAEERQIHNHAQNTEATTDSVNSQRITTHNYFDMFRRINSAVVASVGSDSDNNNEVASSCRLLQPQQQCKYIFYKGKRYSDDISVINTYTGVGTISRAIMQIYLYWDICFAFTQDSSWLSDNFIWLITSFNHKQISYESVERIMHNSNYTPSQKFFYIFHDVVYKVGAPKGFYWSDNRLEIQQLTAKFTDKNDFITKYCGNGIENEAFRNFFRAHSREILHYLKCDSIEKLFEDMPLIYFQRKCEIILMDSSNNYTPSNLGGIEEFKRNMLRPSALNIMQRMIRFLEKYVVSDVGVSKRDIATDQFIMSNNILPDGRLIEEDDSLYDIAGLKTPSVYATEYNAYMTLIREYMRVFMPREIILGDLKFTRSGYSEEIKKIVFEYCEAHFGQVDFATEDRLKKRALFAKSIYERGILIGYHCENAIQIETYLGLLTESRLTLKNYYETFQMPKFRIGRSELTMHGYIRKIIVDRSVYTTCSELSNDERVTSYFEYKIKTDCTALLNDIFKEYQQLYDDFIS